MLEAIKGMDYGKCLSTQNRAGPVMKGANEKEFKSHHGLSKAPNAEGSHTFEGCCERWSWKIGGLVDSLYREQ